MPFFFDSQHAARVTLGVAHARRTIALARDCNELDAVHAPLSTLPFITSLAMSGMPATSVLILQLLSGMRGFVSVSIVPSFLAGKAFLRAAPF